MWYQLGALYTAVDTDLREENFENNWPLFREGKYSGVQYDPKKGFCKLVSFCLHYVYCSLLN